MLHRGLRLDKSLFAHHGQLTWAHRVLQDFVYCLNVSICWCMKDDDNGTDLSETIVSLCDSNSSVKDKRKSGGLGM